MSLLLRLTLAFVIGIWFKSQISFPPVYVGVAAIVLTLALGSLLWTKKGNRYALGVTAMMLMMALGWLRTPLENIPVALQKATAYTATVLSPPETRAKTYKVEVAVVAIKTLQGWQKQEGKILLYLDKAATKPQYGQVLLIRGTPRLVEPPLNPEQFDYRRFLALKQIYHQQYLKSTDFIITPQSQGVFYKRWAYTVSEWADAALKRLVPWPREYAVAKAMTIGVRDEMDSELLSAYSAAGAVHVLSVSGFHITVFMGLLTLLLGRLKKHKKSKWIYLAVTLGILWFYAVLTGLSAPVIRSAVMFSLLLLAEPLGHKSDTQNALFGSALLLLALDPLLLYSVSFQLSYAALAGIIFLQPVIYQQLTFSDWFRDNLWAISAVAITAQLATFPLTVYYFHQFPTYFLLVNPAVMGLGFVMLPVAFLTIALSWVPILASLLGWLLTLITWLLNTVVIGCERLPGAVWGGLSFSLTEMWAVYAILAGLIALGYYKQQVWLKVVLGISTLLMLLQWYENWQARQQQLAVVHAVSSHTVISLIKGQRAITVADSSFFNSPKAYDFFLKNFYIRRGIRDTTHAILETAHPNLLHPTPWGKVLVWQGKKLLLVEKRVGEFPSVGADAIIISKTAYRKADDLQKSFGRAKLVIDQSNKWYVLDTLQKTAKVRQLPWHFVSTSGAWQVMY